MNFYLQICKTLEHQSAEWEDKQSKGHRLGQENIDRRSDQSGKQISRKQQGTNTFSSYIASLTNPVQIVMNF
jgi:hypothetical protein